MQRSKILFFALVFSTCIWSTSRSIAGVLLAPTSYSMPNGGGVASGGSLNYWDLNYSGAGVTNLDGAPLTGGLGDLTDGVLAPAFFLVENGAGTGPYVGWHQDGPNQLNPTVTFNFAGNPIIDQIIVHLDNSSAAGVYAPVNILINGNSYGYVAPTSAGVFAIEFNSLNLSGNQHAIQFFQDTDRWVFVSEIQFFGSTAAVPEPASWAVMLVGLAAVGIRHRSRVRLRPHVAYGRQG